MPYLAINDFKFGMDRRRKQSVGIPGTLWTLTNAVVTRGGDIERAKKFVKTHDLPSGTFGLAALNGQLTVFGSDPEPGGMPDDIEYQRLRHGTPGLELSADMVSVYQAKAFDGKLYVIAAYDNGGLYHFYGGDSVEDWDSVSTDGDSLLTVTRRLAKLVRANGDVRVVQSGRSLIFKALTPGVNFTLTGDSREESGSPTGAAVTVSTLQANVTEIDEVVATATLTISSGSAGSSVDVVSVTQGSDSWDLMDGHSVAWKGSVNATANAVVLAINAGTEDHGFWASATGGVVTIHAAAGTGSSRNGAVVSHAESGTISVSKTNFSGGVNYRAPVAKVMKAIIEADTYAWQDSWAVILNGVEYWTLGMSSNTGDSIFVQKNRVWSTVGGLLRYCKLNDPLDWTDADPSSGAGFINVSSQTEGAQELYAVEDYSGKAAIFAESSVVIYTLAADAQNIAIAQTIKNTGTKAFRSPIAYAAEDVFYLDKTGIRSLKSRDGYDGAYASDIGSPIDPFIRTLIGGNLRDKAAFAKSVIETDDGRLFMVIGARIIVLSYFPGSKITAWSYIQFDHSIDEIVRCDDIIYARAGDSIYAYGGEDGTIYPDENEYVTTVETSFMSASDPAAMKQMKGFDQAAEGEWLVQVLVDPNDKTKIIDVGRLTDTTFNDFAAWFPGYTASFALRFTCSRAGYASMSSIAHHFDKGEKQ